MKKLLLFILLAGFVELSAQCPASVTPTCTPQPDKIVLVEVFGTLLPFNFSSQVYTFTIPTGLGLDCGNLPNNLALNILIGPISVPVDFDFERESPCDDSDGVTYSEEICFFPALNLCFFGTPGFVVDIGGETCVYNTAGVLLPVELVNFEAYILDQGINLTWRTATETNNEGFEIQRSSDAKNWKPLYFQPGAGTTAEPQKYSYLDQEALPGINYYRLKQIDYSGKFEFSEVVSAEMVRAHSEISVFPNPAQEVAYLSLGKESKELIEQGIQLKLYDAFGRFLKNEKVFFNDQQLLEIPMQELPKGVYAIEVETNQQRWSTRLMKQ